MFEIIKRRGYYRKTIFCFSLYQNCDNPHDYQTMFKDIEVEVDGFRTPLNRVFNDIKNCVDDMEYDDEVMMKKTFKSDTCMICLDKEPNVLFCTCGHISICTDCRENLNDKKKCVICKETNQIIRNI